MSRGGPRQNSGRKKGSYSAPMRRSMEIAAKATAEGETPLEYMLRVMRTSNDDRRKDAMAQAAAPYIHPKLASVEHKGDKDSPVTFQVISGVPRQADVEADKPKANGHASRH